MFGKKIRIFKLFGFEVSIDFSWIVIAILVAWSLSTGLFPFHYKNLSTQTYWIMGIIGALGLFLSIVIHEFFHSLVARGYGMQMKGITLFIFGGVAEMGEEPPSAKAEFMMAAVGPLASFSLALIFYAVLKTGQAVNIGEPISGVIGYLAMINGILAGFNLLPAFPLDGGRMLRAVLWGAKKNINSKEKFLYAEVDFHEGIFVASKNRILTAMMHSINNLLIDSRETSIKLFDDLRVSLKQHTDILDAIKARDVEGAGSAMLNHLDAVKHLLEEKKRGKAGVAV